MADRADVVALPRRGSAAPTLTEGELDELRGSIRLYGRARGYADPFIDGQTTLLIELFQCLHGYGPRSLEMPAIQATLRDVDGLPLAVRKSLAEQVQFIMDGQRELFRLRIAEAFMRALEAAFPMPA